MSRAALDAPVLVTLPAPTAEALARALAGRPAAGAIVEVAAPPDLLPDDLLAALAPGLPDGLGLAPLDVAVAVRHRPAAPIASIAPPAAPAASLSPSPSERSFRVQPAAPAELAALVDRFAPIDRRAQPSWLPAQPLAPRLARAAAAGLALVARDGGGAATGLVVAERLAGPAAVGVVHALLVASEARGRGVGLALQHAAVQALYAAGAREIRGGAALHDGAMLRIFERLGYDTVALVHALRLAPRT